MVPATTGLYTSTVVLELFEHALHLLLHLVLGELHDSGDDFESPLLGMRRELAEENPRWVRLQNDIGSIGPHGRSFGRGVGSVDVSERQNRSSQQMPLIPFRWRIVACSANRELPRPTRRLVRLVVRMVRRPGDDMALPGQRSEDPITHGPLTGVASRPTLRPLLRSSLTPPEPQPWVASHPGRIRMFRVQRLVPMLSPRESVLGVLPGVCPSSRTVVVTVTSLCGHASLRLQTESYSDDMGWFPQSSVELSADQLAALRPLMAIASSQMDPPKPRAAAPRGWDDSMPATIPLRTPA